MPRVGAKKKSTTPVIPIRRSRRGGMKPIPVLPLDAKVPRYTRHDNPGPPVYWTEERVTELAKKMFAAAETALDQFISGKTEIIPFISRFCSENELTQVTLLAKAKEYPFLFSALNRFKEVQKEILIIGGLTGRFNPTAFIFTAKNITDMRDVTPIQLSGPDDQPLQTTNYNFDALSVSELLKLKELALKAAPKQIEGKVVEDD